jgi:hypothetical protein
MQVAKEWGPAFIPDMPLEGCAVGLLARTPGSDGTRFFHVVLHQDTPSFLALPRGKVVLPLEEVIRGHLISLHPELEKGETYLFRFMTGEVTVRERVLSPVLSGPGNSENEGDPQEAPGGEGAPASETSLEGSPEPTLDPNPFHPAEMEAEDAWVADAGMEERGGSVLPSSEGPASTEVEPLVPVYREAQESVVVRILARKRMPESYQAQLLRALERQVTRQNPLIGWSDLYPVKGPLDLAGIDELTDLGQE